MKSVEELIKEGYGEILQECGKKIAESEVDEIRFKQELHQYADKKDPAKEGSKRQQYETNLGNAQAMQQYYKDIYEIVMEKLK